ncbi:hypothetical protein [Nocardioides houyundeii]|uniref:hypothetical protein n=1 Tax=Nocardioides houyundeii TaxID=2045452 RepID=UPI00131563E2|nr:hypothetical protein [Nocardioides houyundeii]
MRDLWTTRDLPVLREYVELDATGDDLFNATDDIAAKLGLDSDELDNSIHKLTTAGYITSAATFGGAYVTDVTERGLRTVGAWPDTESGVDRLIAALEALVASAPDEPTRTKRRATLEQVSGLGRDTLAAVVATVITGQLPGSQ